MPIVVGISLRTAGKLYYFDPGTAQYYIGERVLVETARGPELGTVKLVPHEVTDEQIVAPLKPVIRGATASDLAREMSNRDREEAAIEACKRHIARLNLQMRLIDAQYSFDGGHILIHFLADNRVDFRELVRDLARELHARIELRQVGVRDEAKLIGGVGMCGRPLCCSAFLSNFAPVAINMAKVQGLALNPQKISGTCGRLMCCLAFEYEHYRDLRAGMPKINATVETPRGIGRVTKLNLIARQVEVLFPEVSDPLWFAIEDLQGAQSCCGGKAACEHCHEDHQEIEDESIAPIGHAAAPLASMTGRIETGTAQGISTGDEEAARKRARRRRKKPSGTIAAPQAASPTPDNPDNPARNPRRRKRRSGSGVPGNGAIAQSTPPTTPATASPATGTPESTGHFRPRRR